MHDENNDKITVDKEKANGFLNDFTKSCAKDNDFFPIFPFLNSKCDSYGKNFSP